jgi:hypothetical protein
MIVRRTTAAAVLIGLAAFVSAAYADVAYQGGASESSARTTAGRETGPPHPLTLADPELREILSHFKHPDDTGYGQSPTAVAGISAPGYAASSFGSVRPYWPPVVVAHPPRPAFPILVSPFITSAFVAPLLLPAAPSLFFAPAFDFITPGF